MASSWKVIFAFVGVFIAGAVFGGFFTVRSTNKRLQTMMTATTPPPVQPGPSNRPKENRSPNGPGVTPVMMSRLTQHLKLNEDQTAKIKPIVARAGEDWVRLRNENFRDTKRVLERMHADIAEFLTPEQLKDLEKLKLNEQERLRNAEKKQRGDRQQTGQGKLDNTASTAAATPVADPAPKGTRVAPRKVRRMVRAGQVPCMGRRVNSARTGR